MAPIANLTVRISAQIAELQKSFTEATDKLDKFGADFKKTAESLDQSGQKIGTGFDGIVTSAVGVAAGMLTAQAAIGAVSTAFGIAEQAINATFGALQEAVQHTADLGDELFALSQKTGLSVESLSAFKFVAAQTNTSLESITGAVFKLEANLGSGAKNTAAALKDLGLSVADLQKQDPAAAFTTILTKLGEMPGASERAAAGVAIFGKSFKDIAQLSKEDLPALIQQAKDLGVVMSTETAVAADRFHDALGTIHAAAEGLQLQIGAKLLPVLITFAEAFGQGFQQAAKSAGVSAEQFGKAIELAAKQTASLAASIITIFANLTDAVVGWAAQSVLSAAAVVQAQINLATSAINVARVLDQLTTGGNFAVVFDRMQASVNSAQKALDNLVAPIVTAGAGLRTLAQLTAQAATSAGDNFAEAFQRVQTEIAAAANQMRTGGGVIGDGLTKVGKAAKETREDLNGVWKEVEELNQRVQKFDTAAMEREFKELAREAKADIDSIDQRVQRFQQNTDDAAAKAQQRLFELNIPLSFGGIGGGMNGVMFTAGQINSFGLFGQQAATAAVSPFREAFEQLGKDLPDIVFRALQGGGSVVGAVASAVGAQFAKQFAKALADAGGDLSKVSSTNKALGIAGASVGAAFAGYQLGTQLGKGKGALAGAAAGALAGSVVPGIGTAIGAGVGALAGYFGGRAADKKMAEQLAANKQALLEQFGGMQKLTELAAKLGVNIQAAFDAKKPEQFQKTVESLNTALAQQQKRLAGINTALEGVNRRAQTFAAQFAGLDTEKMAEVAQRTQPEFERLGLFIRDTFAAIVKETGNAFDALTQLAPAFQTLKSGITDFGLTSTKVIDSLVASFDLVNNDAFKPFFENIQATGQLLQGLFDAQALSPDTFQAAAADIGQSIQEIINRGGDMAKTLALSAPQLQLLWEAQQKYGQITDQTTQSILDQAVAQGVVGAQFKSVNDKILDVLLAIAEVLGADIPDALKGLGAAARSAAADVTDGLSKIEVPDIKIPVSFESDDPRVRFFGGGEIPELAAGGVVTRPTLALVGEAGPEAVIPLSRLGPAPATVGRGGDVYLDGRKVGKVMLKHVADEAMYQGLVPR